MGSSGIRLVDDFAHGAFRGHLRQGFSPPGLQFGLTGSLGPFRRKLAADLVETGHVLLQ